jgi:hypothetical protein
MGASAEAVCPRWPADNLGAGRRPSAGRADNVWASELFRTTLEAVENAGAPARKDTNAPAGSSSDWLIMLRH